MVGIRAKTGETRARVGVLVTVVFWGSRSSRRKRWFGFVTLRREEPPPRDAWGALALMGFVGVALHGMLQAYALTLTSAGKSGWLIGLIPIWSALLAAVFPGERFGRRKAAKGAFGQQGIGEGAAEVRPLRMRSPGPRFLAFMSGRRRGASYDFSA